MPRFTRHKDFKIQVLRDGQPQAIINVEDADVRENADFEEHQFAGDPTYYGDVERKGFTGTITLRVTDPSVDDFIDLLNQDFRDQTGIHEARLVTTEYHHATGPRSYAYIDCHFKMGIKDSPSQAMTKTLEFRASARQAV